MTDYSLFAFGSMIRDRVRMTAYAEAIRRAVKPGALVLDIGTGTGVLAFLAVQAGAHKVIAVEPSDLIEVARGTADANGYSDRIEFKQQLSTTLELHERVDVVVSDLHGMLPFFGDHIPSIVDARERLRARTGLLIPTRDLLWACPMESPQRYNERVEFWSSRPHDLDLSPARRLAANSWWRAAREDDPLAGPQLLAALDYERIESPNVSATATWSVERAGTLSGFSIWFDSVLHEDVGFSNRPDAPETIYGQGFFPIDEPAEVVRGDSVTLDFAASLLGGDYVYRWDTKVMRPRRGNVSLSNSTIHSFPLTPDRLVRLDERHKPTRTPEGEVLAYLLEHADGDHTTHDLGMQLHNLFPSMFRSPADAVRFATEHALRYCR